MFESPRLLVRTTKIALVAITNLPKKDHQQTSELETNLAPNFGGNTVMMVILMVAEFNTGLGT